MTFHTISRLFFLTLFAVIFGYQLYWADKLEHDDSLTNVQQRYSPLWADFMVPLFLMTWFLLDMLIGGRSFRDAFCSIAAISAVVLCHTTIYYLLLLPLLPWLRKHISARTCGFLWLAPNFIYMTLSRNMYVERPSLILRPPVGLLPLLGWVWLAGIVVVLGWSTVSHLRFRREILRDAVPESDPDVLAVWTAEQHHAGYPKAPYVLVRSSAVRTPLSIGFWKRTIRVVLPERTYTAEELPLVLRHEIVHIGRGDACNKLFLTFCTAMCWFNPLMWLAMRRSAEDFELSCDETVLLNADAPTRRRYAELLLTTGGAQRGFTTCLSSSAQSLRYRLKAVLSPTKRSLGAVVMAAAALLMSLPFGMVTFVWDSDTVEARAFDGEPTVCSVTTLSYFDAEGTQHPQHFQQADHNSTEALLDYLGGLQLEQLAGLYKPSTSENPALYIHYTMDNIPMNLELTDETLVLLAYENYNQRRVYHLPQSPDWDTIQALLPEA